MAEVVEVLVSGGAANPGPPLGPALGPLGVNVKAVVDEINKVTAEYKGIQVPVRIEVEADKSFTIKVGTPPTTALLKQEMKIEKGSADPGVQKVADITMEQVVSVAKMKRGDLLSYDLRSAVKEVLGTCLSLGITVEGKDPREVQRAVSSGEYDQMLSE
ncbi:50S ribosomal protein L11 [Methermicoccus shengliensis]|uniref:Large ribosomal subunit protein uL11 n=1 Tax=Methermicoccus shengliensis TaxID=660064 RepID=A0A832RSL6_9EURY|nr:50S ribosomal protein L11 [Methermicoccus shengliensis]KUK04874.1 MAG: Ribosomal protein L11 [Euryarchaeota archaeon 55_53]KUK30402.1 MAG: Ribosomal protein L11 [Methanosarcinales archeaon 56_1174]MDI3487914.1 large subunit ribosomal protein [Methanosarcinales archaeon]MDN5295344.1 large subunit ribosomal protein [Methanosarcinales archaeon]HIH69568.1 50S ribosomal protein L11 [Methermicoccus shengliensis]